MSSVKSNRLIVYVSKNPERLMISVDPPHTNCMRDMQWISDVFSPEFMRELDRRGYDPTTMKFHVGIRRDVDV